MLEPSPPLRTPAQASLAEDAKTRARSVVVPLVIARQAVPSQRRIAPPLPTAKMSWAERPWTALNCAPRGVGVKLVPLPRRTPLASVSTTSPGPAAHAAVAPSMRAKPVPFQRRAAPGAARWVK